MPLLFLLMGTSLLPVLAHPLSLCDHKISKIFSTASRPFNIDSANPQRGSAIIRSQARVILGKELAPNEAFRSLDSGYYTARFQSQDNVSTVEIVFDDHALIQAFRVTSGKARREKCRPILLQEIARRVGSP